VASSKYVKKGTNPVFTGKNPTKDSDNDYTYTFVGWSLDGETVINLDEYVIEADELTFKPVYFKDEKVKAQLELPDEIASGESADVKIKLNRTDISVGTDGTTEAITGGSLTVTSNKEIFTIDNSTVTFTKVDEEGYVDATVKLTASSTVYSSASFDVTGTVSGEKNESVDVYSISASTTVGGQQAGEYFTDPETVTINKNDGETLPESQTLWSGSVDVSDADGNGVDGITFVYKLDGIETKIVADNFDVNFNNTLGWYSWNWQNGGNNGGMVTASQTFEKNGYFYMYLNKIPNGASAYETVKSFKIFQYTGSKGGPDRTNTNENATFTMLAVVADNLTPTVNFYNEDGSELIETVTKEYTNYSGSLWNSNAKTIGELVTVDDLAKEAEIATPTKTSDIDKVSYVFDGWVDADGNKVDVVYMSQNVYASFKTVDTRTYYKVQFVNEDGSVLQESNVAEKVLPVYSGATPEKASTATNSYEFKGWDKTITAPTGEESADTVFVYTATYTETERMYDVTFVDEDKETKLDKQRTKYEGSVQYGGETPTKASDVQYTYEFDKWVDADGNEVDLSSITADITVYASYKGTLNKYTVTFKDDDKETEIGKSTVDYGTAAVAPEATKADSDYYSYKFDKWVDENGEDADITKVVGDITVYATYSATFNSPFSDTVSGRFYSAAVEYVTVNGIMNGTGANAFSPDSTTTRGMFVTVLYRIEGEPDVSDITDVPFEDLKEGAYYQNAVKWAYSNGVVNGVTETQFGPNSTLTREQFATMLYRYADKIKGYYMSYGRASLSAFVDKNDISDFAKTAIKWAIATKDELQGTDGGVVIKEYDKVAYITGSNDNGQLRLNPKSSATRAQMATILYRFLTSEHIPAED
jgi:hypothetical protein